MTHRLARFRIEAFEDPRHPYFMQLRLAQVSGSEVTGIYGKNKDDLPARMRYLHPDAYQAFKGIAGWCVVSDMLRSAESSLAAVRKKRGAHRPGWSGHNYGFSIDIAVTQVMRNLGLKSKKALDSEMAKHGWYCHRRDGKRKFEEWHYNYFGLEFSKYVNHRDSRTSAGLERKIVDVYGNWWLLMSDEDAQRCLQRLGLYDGDIDGDIGPLSKEAIRVFQRGWALPISARLSGDTKRTLAFVTHDRVLVP